MANILFGEEKNYNIPNESLGKYYLNCLKNRNSNDIVCVDGHTGEELSCRKLLENGIKFTEVLKNVGLQQGDVLAIISDNNINFLSILFGAFCKGVVVNPINPAFLSVEFKHALNLSKPKLIICSNTAIQNVQNGVQELQYFPEIVLFEEDQNNSNNNNNSLQNNLKTLESLLNKITIDVDTFTPDDFADTSKQGAVILLSSGTTGLPKAVLLSHFNLINIIGYFGDNNYFDSASKTALQVLQIYHIYGLILQHQSIAASLKTIIVKKFIPELFLSCLEKYEVNITFVVPSILLFLVKNQLVSKYNISKLEDIVVGAAPVGNELQHEVKLKFPHLTINETYGTTELAGSCTLQTRKCNKAGSCGRLVPGMIGKVTDVDTKQPVTAGELGEMCFKGAQAMKEYLGNAEETQNSFDKDGFYHTGDLGYYDEDGFFYIIDRLKELIKYQGVQVPPAEVENLLLTHPCIKDCGVVGAANEISGQVALAFIVKQPSSAITEEEIVNFVAERMSFYKRLYGGVRFVEEIPRNPSGKILRRILIKLLDE